MITHVKTTRNSLLLHLLLLALILPSCRKTREISETLLTDGVVVKISYGSEKKGFLSESIEAFHATQPRTAGGKAIRIEARAEGSAESMEAILKRESDADVWSPASTLLVDVLNARWAEAPGNLGSTSKIVEEAPPLVLSPVVIAMWEPMARALGWPEKQVGWGEVVELSMSKGGWAQFDKPQWGDFRFGHTHPRFSNSGAIALIAAAYAGASKTRDLTAADVEKSLDFVRGLQSHVVHYGRSTGFFAEKMFTRGPGYLSAAVLYENLVAESYSDPAYRSKPYPVVAIYPKEGTFWADHPYAILNTQSMTAEKREAAEVFKKFLLSPERQKAALSRFGFRPSDPNIPLGAPIDAAHGLDPAQPKNVLPSPDVSVIRLILDRFESVKRPVSITFILDVSGSMKGEPLSEAKAGAQLFIENLSSNDLVRLMFFSTRVHWAMKDPGPVSKTKPVLVNAINEAFASGETALYDAIGTALAEQGGPPGAIRAVVVLTDGRDTASSTRLEDLLVLLQRASGAEEGSGGALPRVFTIGYGSGADPEVLKRIAEAGGGAFFSSDPKNIRSVYAELATFF